jgi:hypothetical protein
VSSNTEAANVLPRTGRVLFSLAIVALGSQTLVYARYAAGSLGPKFCRSWPNQQVVTVKGAHFLMEDSPNEVGDAIARFVQKVFAGQITRQKPEIQTVT